MIWPNPLTEAMLPCPIPPCRMWGLYDDLSEHIRLKHPEPPVPAEIIVLPIQNLEVAK